MEENQKKEAKTRTSITINPAVLDATRKYCELNNISVSSFIEAKLAEALGVEVSVSVPVAAPVTEVPAEA